MEVRAVTKFSGISAHKGHNEQLEKLRKAEDAMSLLGYMPQSAAKVVAKTIKSALANATENFGLDAGDMYIAKIFADDAPIRKWRRFGARGRFKPWLRRSSHVTVVLEDRATVSN